MTDLPVDRGNFAVLFFYDNDPFETVLVTLPTGFKGRVSTMRLDAGYSKEYANDLGTRNLISNPDIKSFIVIPWIDEGSGRPRHQDRVVRK